MTERIEISFNPHGAGEEWPHLLANVGEAATVERLYELLPDGWRCTFVAGGPGGFEGANDPLDDPELEAALWEGAEALTADPDVEALVRLPGETTWRSWREAPRG